MKTKTRIAESKLRGLLDAHEPTADLYVRVHADHLILGRREPLLRCISTAWFRCIGFVREAPHGVEARSVPALPLWILERNSDVVIRGLAADRVF